MSSASEILGVAPQADAAEIHRRYLQLVREFPPDRAPEKFAAIRAAYDELRDPLQRLSKELFATSNTDSLSALAADVRERLKSARIPLNALLSLADAP